MLNSYSINKWKLLKPPRPFRRAFCLDNSFKPLKNCYAVFKHVSSWHWRSFPSDCQDLWSSPSQSSFPPPLFFFVSSLLMKVEKREKTNYPFSVALRQFRKAKLLLDNHCWPVRQIWVQLMQPHRHRHADSCAPAGLPVIHTTKHLPDEHGLFTSLVLCKRLEPHSS